MRKHKIEFKKYADMHEEVEVTGKDGTVVKVRTHIPYEEKLKLAQELIEQVLMVHDDSVCYVGHLADAVEMKMILEYYTDVKTQDVAPEVIADFMINNDLWYQIGKVIHDDWVKIEAIRTSFGFMFNGEDITESLAKAEATKDTLYKALNALNEKEKAEQEKINGGKLMVGSNIINFSKRG